ncbi:dephospho-CoA kinase [Entomobacter blattae]|uniref:Dephospho-CoA kinase n=1 Tax=Entomobacter blattae TaxID=2762277 RepID=A0A7H1NSB0_9PROT|nr:dephospho-CoA kinase [Entomobacter blattae]QNT78670.1 Dephospho-CoA kinase [Entomobacter blattae]
MLVVGLTGGMGMGKTTIAHMFRRAGIPVFDADACVHVLQSPGGEAVPLIARLFPDVVEKGIINRSLLREKVRKTPKALYDLEQVIHPLVKKERQRFIRQMRRRHVSLCMLDIPLLYEVGIEKECSVVITVSAPPSLQRQRIMKRRSMTAAQAEKLIQRQMPDFERRRRANFTIFTGLSLWNSLRQVRKIITALRAEGERRYGTHRFV